MTFKTACACTHCVVSFCLKGIYAKYKPKYLNSWSSVNTSSVKLQRWSRDTAKPVKRTSGITPMDNLPVTNHQSQNTKGNGVTTVCRRNKASRSYRSRLSAWFRFWWRLRCRWRLGLHLLLQLTTTKHSKLIPSYETRAFIYLACTSLSPV